MQVIIDLDIPPGEELYRSVLALALYGGTSLTKIAKQYGTNQSGAKQILLGGWNGEKGKRIRNLIINDLKLKLGGKEDVTKEFI